MTRSRSKILLRGLLPLCMAWLCLSAAGQSKFNSPQPFLLSRLDFDVRQAKAGLDGRAADLFTPGTGVDLYVENIASSLLKGEGAGAFRLYAADAQGRLYRFPAVSTFRALGVRNGIGIRFALTDDTRAWAPPATYEGMSIWVTWRGLATNVVKLATGQPENGKLSTVRTKTPKQGPTAEFSPFFSADRNRFMEQATFGYSPTLNSEIRTKGIALYLDNQLIIPATMPTSYPSPELQPTSPPAKCNKSQNPDLDPVDPPDEPADCYRDTYTLYPLQRWFFTQAFHGEAQVRNRVAWALSQIWVTSGVEIKQSRPMLEYYKILYRNAFGNYRTLMGEMTLNPAMGDYLDMSVSTATSPNENYPRELMQLFTLGTFQLNLDGTPKCEINITPCKMIPTYIQTDVNNFSKAFTGWTFCHAVCDDGEIGGNHGLVLGATNYIAKMKVDPANHDLGSKALLNYPGAAVTSLAACSSCNVTEYADTNLSVALDNIYGHPNIAPFVSKLLIQHLVRSDPTPAYVARVATVFNANKTSPTQMKEVIRAILLDTEASGDIKSDATYGKLREPVLFATGFLRALGVKGYGGFVFESDGVIFKHDKFLAMSQLPFMSPSVFNYYSPKNVLILTDASPSDPPVLAPEFGLMTPTTAVTRPNFANLMIKSGIDTSPDRPNGTALDLSDLEFAATQDSDGSALLNILDQRLLHGRMTAAMKLSIKSALDPVTDPLARAKEAAYLVVTSSQFQVQR